jgi:hypothetical protein
MSSVSSFVNEHILRRSSEATAQLPPPVPIPSPPAAARSPPSATPSAAPAAAPALPPIAPLASSNAPAPPAAPAATPAAPSAGPAGPPVSTPRRDTRGKPPSKSAANCGAAREDCYPWSGRRAPFEDDGPRAFGALIPEGIRRNSRTAGPCVGGVGGCSWGGSQY